MESKTDNWLNTLETAFNSRFPEGIMDTMVRKLFMVFDNGWQPTSKRYMEVCSGLGFKYIFASWSNPKDNEDTESVFRILKEDLIWSDDWDDPLNFQRVVEI